jgi:hypothetical protein
MLNLINIGSAVANHRNLVDPIQRTNIRGLMAERFRTLINARKVILFSNPWKLTELLFSIHSWRLPPKQWPVQDPATDREPKI